MIDLRELGYEIIGACYEVHKQLGRFLYEGIYEQALQHELQLRGIECKRQVTFPVKYKDLILENAQRIDLLVENKIIIELKSLESMGPSEVSQILSYLKFTQLSTGYLINFGAKDFTTAQAHNYERLTKGIYRFIRS